MATPVNHSQALIPVADWDPDELHQLEYIQLTSNVLLIISSVLILPIIVTNLIMKSRRQGPALFATQFLFINLIFNLAILSSSGPSWSGADSWANDSTEASSLCTAQAVVVHVTVCAMIYLWAVIAIVLRHIVVLDMGLDGLLRYRWKYQLAWILPTVCLAMIALLLRKPERQMYSDFCWLAQDPRYKFAVFHVEMLVAAAIGLWAVSSVVRKLCNIWRANQVQSYQIRDYVCRHTLYVILFFLEGILLGQYDALRWWAEDNTVQKSTIILSVWAFTVAYSSVGIMLFLVFGTSTSLWHLWLGKCGCAHWVPGPRSMVRSSTTELEWEASMRTSLVTTDVSGYSFDNRPRGFSRQSMA